MYDIVLDGALPGARGISHAAPAASLRNFKKANSQPEAKQCAKTGKVLLYSPGYEIDDGALLDVSRAGGAVVFSFSDLLLLHGFRRAILLSKMRLLADACRRVGAGMVFCSMASEAGNTRNARELRSFAYAAGLSSHEAAASGKLLEALVKYAEKGAEGKK
ncbi:MAG: hypothetical protein NT051_02060 [Candidatus Micrarchaeota archaeon]|nr:hypothetical protein [Candidatus Micrarchaeota archaeon]